MKVSVVTIMVDITMLSNILYFLFCLYFYNRQHGAMSLRYSFPLFLLCEKESKCSLRERISL